MRKFTFFTAFFLVCFSIFGQAPDQKPDQASVQKPKEYKVYVSPITGYGKEKDTDYFYNQLGYEVFFQHHVVVGAQDKSNYIFKGKIEPVGGVPSKVSPSEQAQKQKEDYSAISKKASPPVINAPGRREYFSIENSEDIFFLDSKGDVGSMPPEVAEQMEEKGYYFILEMVDNKTGETVGKRKMLFYVTDASVGKLVNVIVSELFAEIPPIPKRGDSRDRWLYFETSTLWMPKYYYYVEEEDSEYNKDNLPNFIGYGMKLGMEIHFAKYLSLGVGVQATQEQIKTIAKIKYEDEDEDEIVNVNVIVTDFMLEVPLALKFVFSIDNNYSLEPYGGFSFNYSLRNAIMPKYSWFAGVQFGIKDKSETGMFVIDARFLMDLDKSSVSFKASEEDTKTISYMRYCAQIGLGYKFGAVQKKR